MAGATGVVVALEPVSKMAADRQPPWIRACPERSDAAVLRPFAGSQALRAEITWLCKRRTESETNLEIDPRGLKKKGKPACGFGDDNQD